jgi:hypothetical protein
MKVLEESPQHNYVRVPCYSHPGHISAYRSPADVTILLTQKNAVQAGRQVLAGGSLLRRGQTQVGEPKIGEHAQ